MPPDLATDTPSDVAGGAGPSDLSQFASSVLPSTDTRGADLEAQRRGASERERSTAEAVAARATSGGAALRAVSAARPRDVPETPTLPTQPSTEARPFLQPGKGLLQQMNTVMLGLGQLALGIGGLKGSAIAATAAYKGALEGWHQGDTERVDRSMTEWKAATERMLAQHRLALDKFRARLEDNKATWEETLGALQVDLTGSQWTAAAAAAEKRDINGLLTHYETARYRASMLETQNKRLDAEIARYNGAQKAANLDPAVRHYLAQVLHVDPVSATDADITKATSGVEAKKLAEEQRKRGERREDREATIEATSEAIEGRAAAREKAKEQATEKKAQAKRDGAEKDLNRIEAIIGRLDTKKLLPKSGASLASSTLAKWNREWFHPTDPDFVSFVGIFSPIMVGEIDRSLYDEKGVRAVQMFRKQFDMMDHIPSAEAMRAFIAELKGSIRDKNRESGASAPNERDPLGILR